MSEINNIDLEDGTRLSQLAWAYPNLEAELTDGYGLYTLKDDGYWHRLDNKVYSIP